MNMHINIGDKLVVTKKLTGFFEIGDVIEVTNVSESGTISFDGCEGYLSSGFMDSTACEEYFERVVSETKIMEAPTITAEYIAEIMENSEFETHTVFNKCTIVSCRLPNGFVITESSSCVNPEDFDAELAEEICFDKIAEKIWELEAYRLQQHLWEEEVNECPCPCCC